ncbi:MAG: hypothetical protein IAF58_23260 [Leptolyngbya sp.]|nr:hypothetical protein [Candidatus Melainabacteria bacterium]
MKPAKLSIQLPTQDLTAGDIVGKAFRIARLNWRVFFQIFLLPNLCALLGSDAIFWAAEKEYVPRPIAYGVIAASAMLMFFAVWEIAVRKQALLNLIAQDKFDLRECLVEAKKNSAKILVMISPVIMIEFLTNGGTLIALIFLKQASGEGIGREANATIGMVILGLLLLSIIPSTILSVSNTFFLTIYANEQQGIWATLVRFFNLVKQELVLCFIYVLLMVAACMIIILATFIEMPFEWLPKSWLTDFGALLTGLIFVGPIQAFFTAATTVGSAMLYKQIRARHDGSDLIERLSMLETETQK